MTIIKNITKDSEKKHVKNQILSEEGKNKRQKRPEKDTKILLKKKKKRQYHREINKKFSVEQKRS